LPCVFSPLVLFAACSPRPFSAAAFRPCVIACDRFNKYVLERPLNGAQFSHLGQRRHRRSPIIMHTHKLALLRGVLDLCGSLKSAINFSFLPPNLVYVDAAPCLSRINDLWRRACCWDQFYERAQTWNSRNSIILDSTFNKDVVR